LLSRVATAASRNWRVLLVITTPWRGQASSTRGRAASVPLIQGVRRLLLLLLSIVHLLLLSIVHLLRRCTAVLLLAA